MPVATVVPMTAPRQPQPVRRSQPMSFFSKPLPVVSSHTRFAALFIRSAHPGHAFASSILAASSFRASYLRPAKIL